MSQRRYALVGAGHRAQMYVDAIVGRYSDDAALVSLSLRLRQLEDAVHAAIRPERNTR